MSKTNKATFLVTQRVEYSGTMGLEDAMKELERNPPHLNVGGVSVDKGSYGFKTTKPTLIQKVTGEVSIKKESGDNDENRSSVRKVVQENRRGASKGAKAVGKTPSKTRTRKISA